ncbi:uncharacterized protein LOC110032851 [Phalaenopsis equestris]|uniref:uncharacterized protein LOC110032851 n=1 Tax=Phalaenopsis equestris TaxID=78828 RepID=UPI0009E41A98|nr:uncharacterized protein LOC110032851 [Phalaenopsis equestris]
MDSVLLESPMEERSPDLGLYPETNYELMLRESIKRFLAGILREGFDFTVFRTVISRQLQSCADPPLEIVWLYSAASYHESIAAKNSFNRVRIVRDLLQLLSAFSAAGGGAKSIALIAPAVYDLYQCAVDGLVERKEMKEIECLAEAILSYISICSGQYNDVEAISTELHPCFLDLVKVWTLRHSGSGGSLEAFFPLISSEVRRRFEMEGCGVGYLAGVVVTEAFLLRLCLKVKIGGASRKELQKELGIWAVSSITVFCNRHFFEILLKYLLDRKVNAAALLNTEDEQLVRGVLYDAVVLVDYSFLLSVKDIDQYDRIRNLLIAKLIVTNEAVELARTNGDHGKAISYLNAFSTSSLRTELVNSVRNQIGNSSTQKPKDNSPKGLLKWLVHLEQMGKRILDDEASKYAKKLMCEESNLLAVQSASADEKNMDVDLFFFDKGESKGDEMESMDAAFISAAQSMKQISTNGRVKRKESTGEAGNRVKFVKYDIQNNLFENSGMLLMLQIVIVRLRIHSQMQLWRDLTEFEAELLLVWGF